MRADAKLSIRFLQTQDQHQVQVLVTVAGEMPTRRPPINVALVLDRSGSMAGAPLEAAKAAAERFAECLGTDDRLAVVTFDDEVNTLFTGAGGGSEAAARIRAIESGGCTNLSGGWLEGRRLVTAGKVEGTDRVVLFTDGLANRGVTDLPRLVGMAGGTAKDGVTTSCIGFGPQFSEDLLSAMAASAQGHFWYVESLDQMTGAFEDEIEGLVALAAQNVVVRVTPVHPDVHGVSIPGGLPVEQDGTSWVVRLGDLLATSPRELPIRFHVNELETLASPDGAATGTPGGHPVELARVEVLADELRPDGVLLRRVVLPIAANLDRTDQVEPVVEETLLRFEAVDARRRAVDQADRGDLAGAAEILRGAAEGLRPYEARSPRSAEVADDLREQARVMEERKEWLAEDRKYQFAVGEAEARGRYDAVTKRRRRGPGR
ncbi:MAG: vWA domain-containing protein [Gemmatimonadales bacterium]